MNQQGIQRQNDSSTTLILVFLVNNKSTLSIKMRVDLQVTINLDIIVSAFEKVVILA